MNFIRYNLISKILSKYRDNRDYFLHEGFFYFDTKINNINRIGYGFLYKEDEIMPFQWQDISGKDLVKILKQFQKKNFYFFKEIEGKHQKIKPKKRVKNNLS
jgi:hypothetical protein